MVCGGFCGELEFAASFRGHCRWQGYEPADAVIPDVEAALWTADLEGHTREASMKARDHIAERGVERERGKRQAVIAAAEEDRAAAIEKRILEEKQVLRDMKAEIVRVLAKAEVEVKRAERAESELVTVKVATTMFNASTVARCIPLTPFVVFVMFACEGAG